MSLLGLADELLVQIATDDHSIESQRLVESLSLTCRRLHTIAMRVFYSRIICHIPHERMFDRDWNSHQFYRRRFGSRPENAALVTLASLYYDRRLSDLWEILFDLLPNLVSLRELSILPGIERIFIGSSDSPSLFDVTLSGSKSNFVQLLKACRLNNLRAVNLSDRDIHADDILSFLALPNIETLRLVGFKGRVVTPNNRCWSSALTRLEVSSDLVPRGKVVETLLKPLSNLKYFSWTTQEHPRSLVHPTSYWSPKDIEFALLSCKKTLESVEVTLKIENQHTHLPHFDLSGFCSLSHLRVNSRILFPQAGPFNPPSEHHNLRGRLPASIRSLEIVFDAGDNAFTTSSANSVPQKPFWFLSLADLKKHQLPRLDSIKLSEESYDSEANQKSWVCPGSACHVFSSAGIAFQVLLRAEK